MSHSTHRILTIGNAVLKKLGIVFMLAVGAATCEGGFFTLTKLLGAAVAPLVSKVLVASVKPPVNKLLGAAVAGG